MLYAVVFAGGLSSRMGRNKAFLEYQGETLLHRALGLLDRAGAEQVLISGAVPGYDGVPDLLPQQGPPGALYSTVSSIQTRWGLHEDDLLLVIPVDMPVLHEGVLMQLLKALGKADAACYQHEVFPCVFRLSESFLAFLEAGLMHKLAGGRFSMKAILAAQDAREVDPSNLDPAVFSNLNTPDDYENL